MQILPAAPAAPAPAATVPAAEGAQLGAGQGRTSSEGLSFESVLAANIMNARDQRPVTEQSGQKGEGQGLVGTPLDFLSRLRPKAKAQESEEPQALPDEEAAYLLAGTLAQVPPDEIAEAPPEELPQQDRDLSFDTVAHILEGEASQAAQLGSTQQVSPQEEGQPAGAQAQPQDDTFAPEALARMPQPQETPDPAGPAPADARIATDGDSCPLENVNDPLLEMTRQALQQATEQPQVTAAVADTADTPEPIPAQAQAAEAPEPAAEAAPLAQTERAPAPAEEPSTTGQEGREGGGKQGDEPALATQAPQSQPMDIGALRAQGELQMQHTAEQPAPVATTETLLDTMVEQMSLTRQGDSHQMEIQLRPEHLGKVSILLTLDENGLQAKLRAEDPTVRSLIGSQINQLVDSLEQKGIKLAQVEVTYQAPQSQDFSQSGGNGREQMNQESRNKPLAAQGIDRGERPQFADALEVDTYTATGDPLPEAASYRA